MKEFKINKYNERQTREIWGSLTVLIFGKKKGW